MKLAKLLLIILLSTLIFVGCTSKRSEIQQGEIMKITEKGKLEIFVAIYLYPVRTFFSLWRNI